MSEYPLKKFGLFIVMSLVLLNYQNCGSAKNITDTPTDASAGGSEMDIINPVIAGGISFVQTKAVVTASDTDLAIDGLCSLEQSGGLIGWKATDENNTLMAEGKSLCDRGAFEVLFAGVDSLACGSKITLKAAFGAKSKSEVLIEKNCL